MRITESRLRRIIRSVIAESIDDHDMSGDYIELSDRMGSRPENYAGMGGAPSNDLNNPILVGLANVIKDMYTRNPRKYDEVFSKMFDRLVMCDSGVQLYCDELINAINMGNDNGIRECLYYICQKHKCCEIILKCCAGVDF